MKDVFEKPTANFIIVKYCKCFPKFGNKKGYLPLDLGNGEKYYIPGSEDSLFSTYPFSPHFLIDPVKP